MLDCWAIKLMREGMDRDYPGWTEETFFCPTCREDHVLVSDAKQQRELEVLGKVCDDACEQLLVTRDEVVTFAPLVPSPLRHDA